MRTARSLNLTLLTALAAIVVGPSIGFAQSGLVSTLRAERLGLKRAWFSQAQIDFGRHRIAGAELKGDHLFVLAESGVLHAMEAATGKTAWVARVGNPEYPSLGPSANEKYVAVVNGSTVYLIDRVSGLEASRHELGGGPGGGPAITENHVYVPMFNGRLESYPLDEPREVPWYYTSAGRVFDAPSATTQSLVWPTERGYLYVANPESDGIRYRFESSGRVIGGANAVDGTLFLTSANGYLYALNELNGQQLWRYSTGTNISQPPMVVGGIAYVPTDEPSLHAVNVATGEIKWISPGVAKMAGVSESRVYGLDRLGNLMVIAGASGVPLGRVAASQSTEPVVNPVNDRIYLVTDTGLVQCLHEVGSDEPYMHQSVGAEGDKPEQPGEQPGDQPAENPDAGNPFGGGEDNPFGGGGGDNPFGGGGGDNPFGGGGGDNPFGGGGDGGGGGDNPFGGGGGDDPFDFGS